MSNLISEASEIVLELGSDIRSQLPRYDISKIIKIYGVESIIDLYKSLRENIKISELINIYEIISYSIKDIIKLKKHDIVLSSINTILSI